jgi:hypothetical protein
MMRLRVVLPVLTFCTTVSSCVAELNQQALTPWADYLTRVKSRSPADMGESAQVGPIVFEYLGRRMMTSQHDWAR